MRNNDAIKGVSRPTKPLGMATDVLEVAAGFLYRVVFGQDFPNVRNRRPDSSYFVKDLHLDEG